MKKGILSATAFAVMLAAVGCSGAHTEETSLQTEFLESQETEQSELFLVDEDTLMETEGEAETGDAQIDEKSEKRTRTAIGTLEEITLEQAAILSDNGNELVFPVETAEIDLPAGIMAGNLVAVDYTGKLREDDTEGVSVMRIAGSADTDKLESDSEGEPSDNAVSVQTGRKHTMRGTLEGLTMSTALVKTEDGTQITFGTIRVPLYFKYGLSQGVPVKVVYRGSFEGTDATGDTVKVVRIVGTGKKES